MDMKRILLITLLSLLLSGTANATSGTALLEQCSANTATGVGAVKMSSCIGYISGVIDTLKMDTARGHIENTLCIPKGVGIVPLRDVAIRLINNAPEYQNYTASVLVMAALNSEFPCPK